MSATASFEDFYRHWQDSLYRMERAWEQMLKEVKTLRGGLAQSWISANSALRKKDPLLRYLKHARDAETHVLSQTVENVIQLSIEDRLNRKFRVDSIETTIEGKTLVIDIKTPDDHMFWKADLKPGDPRLLRFKSRGEWYNPPHLHLGTRIPDFHPVAVALLGCKFYFAASAVAPVQNERSTTHDA